MATEPSPPKSITSNPILIMGYDKSRAKQPFMAPPISDELCGWIGKMAITWGLVELQLNALIEALISVLHEEEPRWKRRNFRKRKELCKTLAGKVFWDCPVVVRVINTILGTAADLHWRRNHILHGELRCTLSARLVDSSTVEIQSTLFAKGTHNGKETTISFYGRGIEDFFYQIANICGLFNQFLDPDSEEPPLPFVERHRLQDFLRSNLPNRPIL